MRAGFTAVLVLAGMFFLLVSAVGLARLPDFYSRTHAAGKSETMGAVLILGGVLVHEGVHVGSIKVLLVLLFIAITSPTGIHALCRAAARAGLEMWTAPAKEHEA